MFEVVLIRLNNMGKKQVNVYKKSFSLQKNRNKNYNILNLIIYGVFKLDIFSKWGDFY